MRFGSQSSEPPARAQPGMNSNPSYAPRQLAQQLLTAMPLSQHNGRIKGANAHTALPTVPGML